MHGQWDWMNDPRSTPPTGSGTPRSRPSSGSTATTTCTTSSPTCSATTTTSATESCGWPEQKWSPFNLGQPVYNAALGQPLPVGRGPARPRHRADPQGREGPEGDEAAAQADLPQGSQPGAQGLRRLPSLSGRQWKTTMVANATANLARNLWSYVIIFCGHFPDGALHFTEEEIEDETRAEWYLRQILGAANFKGGPLLHIMSGNLGFRSSTTSTPTCRATGTPRSRCGSGSSARSTTSPTRPARSTSSTARRCARSSSCRCPTAGPRATSPSRPPLAWPAGRRSDDERPARIQELGVWSRGRSRERQAVLDAHRGFAGARPALGHQCALSRICGGCAYVAGPSGRVPRNAGRGRPQRVPPAAAARGVRRGAAAGAGSGPELAAGHDGWVRVRPVGARTSTGSPGSSPTRSSARSPQVTHERRGSHTIATTRAIVRRTNLIRGAPHEPTDIHRTSLGRRADCLCRLLHDDLRRRHGDPRHRRPGELRVLRGGPEYTFEFDITAWGWILLLLGIAVAAVGTFLYMGQTWARWTALVVVALSMIANFVWVPYYPVWGIIVLALDAAVIWALTVDTSEQF